MKFDLKFESKILCRVSPMMTIRDTRSYDKLMYELPKMYFERVVEGMNRKGSANVIIVIEYYVDNFKMTYELNTSIRHSYGKLYFTAKEIGKFMSEVDDGVEIAEIVMDAVIVEFLKYNKELKKDYVNVSVKFKKEYLV